MFNKKLSPVQCISMQIRLISTVILSLSLSLTLMTGSASAAVDLEIKTITFDRLWIDGNSYGSGDGPVVNQVGARICNKGTTEAQNVTVTFSWLCNMSLDAPYYTKYCRGDVIKLQKTANFTDTTDGNPESYTDTETKPATGSYTIPAFASGTYPAASAFWDNFDEEYYNGTTWGWQDPEPDTFYTQMSVVPDSADASYNIYNASIPSHCKDVYFNIEFNRAFAPFPSYVYMPYQIAASWDSTGIGGSSGTVYLDQNTNCDNDTLTNGSKCGYPDNCDCSDSGCQDIEQNMQEGNATACDHYILPVQIQDTGTCNVVNFYGPNTLTTGSSAVYELQVYCNQSEDNVMFVLDHDRDDFEINSVRVSFNSEAVDDSTSTHCGANTCPDNNNSPWMNFEDYDQIASHDRGVVTPWYRSTISDTGDTNAHWMSGGSKTGATTYTVIYNITSNISGSPATPPILYIMSVQSGVGVKYNSGSNNDTTFISLADFKAYESGGSTVIEWSTAAEIDTAGFYLLRREPGQERFQQVNDRLLPSLQGAGQGADYIYIDETAEPGIDYEYKLVEIENRGFHNQHGPFRMEAAPLETSVIEAGQSGFSMRPRQMTKANKELNEQSRKQQQAAMQKKKERGMVAPAGLQSGKGLTMTKNTLSTAEIPAIKVIVAKSGLYALTSAEIAGLFNIQSEQLAAMIARGELTMTNSGKPVQLFASPDNGTVYFHGTGIDSIYTDENVYWLKLNKAVARGTTPVIAPAPLADDAMGRYETASFTRTIRLEENNIPSVSAFDDPAEDYWTWKAHYSIYPALQTSAYNFDLTAPDPNGGNAALRVVLRGVSGVIGEPDHHALIKLNNTVIGEDWFDNLETLDREFTFNAALLQAGANSIEVTALNDEGVEYSIFMVDFFELSYPALYVAENDALAFRGGSNSYVSATGFTSPDIYLLDVTNPNRPLQVEATVVSEGSGVYSLVMTPEWPETEYLAVSANALAAVKAMYLDIPSQLRKAKGAEYLVITPAELKDQALKLAAYRVQTGLQTMVVELEDIMDEFNHGITSVTAIRDFLAHAAGKWNIPPAYVVLAGSGTFDYKDYMGYGDNLIPTTLVNTPYGMFASDNYFVDFSRYNRLPQISIGRLPARTAEELDGYISKIKVFESNGGPGAWNDQVLLLAGRVDEVAGNFPVDSDKLAEIFQSSVSADKIYLSDSTLDGARQQIFNSINTGVGFVNYFGHAGMNRLTADRSYNSGILLAEDTVNLTNSDRMPVMTLMTCVAGRFDYPGFQALAEELAMDADGSAAAVWSSTGLSENDMAVKMSKEFYRQALLEGAQTVGQAILKARQAYMADSTNKKFMLEIYNLLGDPALNIQ